MAELSVTNAYDQTEIAKLPMQDEAACMGRLERAHSLFQDRDRWLAPHERIAILEKLARLVDERVDALALQASREGGKPLQDSIVEVRRGAEGIRTAIAEIRALRGEEIPMSLSKGGAGRIGFTYRDPRGVVLSISAFNHPFNLIIHQVVPALAVGCPVLIKPALTTPLSCKALVELLAEAGLPDDWCTMVLCENEVAGKLVADARVSFMSFIGSAKVGWTLRSQLPVGAACALEHGGVAPAIVDETADLDDAIPLLLKGGFYHAGQVCVSVQRIYVHDSVFAAFTERFVEGAKALTVGDPTVSSTEVGPLILPREVDRVHEWVQEATHGGAELLCGGSKRNATCYEPTVLVDPPADAKISSQEVFGPVVALYRYSELEDAIARANAPDAFFQASIFTQNMDVALRAHRRLRGMAVMVNDHTAFRVDWMPFGGHMSSGLGVGGIGYTMRDLTLERLLVVRSKALR